MKVFSLKLANSQKWKNISEAGKPYLMSNINQKQEPNLEINSGNFNGLGFRDISRKFP